MSHDEPVNRRAELDAHRKYLAILLIKQAQQGINTPPSQLLEIDERRQAISTIKQQLRALGETIADDSVDSNDPVEQARSLFEQLPTDEVPAPEQQAIATISRIERSIDGYFVGRDAVLMQIAQYIKQGSHTVVSTGMGGVGKSTLAKAFAYRYGQYFAGGVFWVSFATIPSPN